MSFDQATALVAVISSAIAPLTALGGVWLGNRLSRRGSQELRLRDLNRSAILDTREWLLDVIDTIELAIAGRWWHLGFRRKPPPVHRRYPRHLPELIVDERLIEELATTLPEAYESLPRVPRDLASRFAEIKFLVSRAMLDQERCLETTGQFKIASEAQQRRLTEGAERIQRKTASIQGRGRIAFVLRTLFP